MSSGGEEFLSVCSHRAVGRAVCVRPDGALYRSVHLRIDRSDDDGATWRAALTIPRPRSRVAIEPFRLIFYQGMNGTRRQWVFERSEGVPRWRSPSDDAASASSSYIGG